MVRSASGNALVLGPQGRLDLTTGRLDGLDPLDAYGPRAAENLLHLDGLSNVGDLILLGALDRVSEEGPRDSRNSSVRMAASEAGRPSHSSCAGTLPLTEDPPIGCAGRVPPAESVAGATARPHMANRRPGRCTPTRPVVRGKKRTTSANPGSLSGAFGSRTTRVPRESFGIRAKAKSLTHHLKVGGSNPSPATIRFLLVSAESADPRAEHFAGLACL